jgi:hypothetical protein
MWVFISCSKTNRSSVTIINRTSVNHLTDSVNYVAFHGLHPSKLEYTKWAIKLTQKVKNVFEAGEC